MVSPGEFIPIAEASQQIAPISDWVINEACQELVRWRGTPLDGLPVSVNVSPMELGSVDLSEMIRRKLAQYGLSPRLLEIEVSAKIEPRDFERTVTQLQK